MAPPPADPTGESCLQGTDSSFAAKLRQRQGSHSRLSYNPKGSSDDFTLHHYAGPVMYCCDKFLDKNKDTLSPGGAQGVIVVISIYTAPLFVKVSIPGLGKRDAQTWRSLACELGQLGLRGSSQQDWEYAHPANI